ncbi:hypothetical protein B0T22DRAFT_148433 [Podospora appendiculata]|uniref:C2H2-type domain-containing protein n=1 Tax=Podospora appendiculata TaxID=314037 RepID=A0AAE0X8V6_9PEZI|nr:hypothetical protein B0T22DRAFT_148433 [Podospora appendiculata]
MYGNQYSPYSYGMERGNWSRGYAPGYVAGQYAGRPAISPYASDFDGSYPYRDTYRAGYEPWTRKSSQSSFDDSYNTEYHQQQPDVYNDTTEARDPPVFSQSLNHYGYDYIQTGFASGSTHPSTTVQTADVDPPYNSDSDDPLNAPPADSDPPVLPSYFACVVPSCTAKTSKQAELRKHYTRKHPDETQESLAAYRAVQSPIDQPENIFTCQVPGCTSQKAFTRRADLDRHYKRVHVQNSNGDPFVCDYKKCPRHKAPFSRIGHFKDHLRDYHKEDLPRRGVLEDAEWWSSRSVKAMFGGWWRCSRCLKRVYIGLLGGYCDCGNECESERWMRRAALGAFDQGNARVSGLPGQSFDLDKVVTFSRY